MAEFPSTVSEAVSRPSRPDPTVLAQAARGLEELRGAEVDRDWAVVGQLTRHRSTIFRVQVKCAGEVVVAYYKQIHRHSGPDQERDDRRVHRAREAMLAEMRLSARLSDALAGADIGSDRPLALVPDRLIGVRLAVAGRPLGRAISTALPGRRATARRCFRNAGAAMRVVEEVGSMLPVPAGTPTLSELLHREFARSARVLDASDRSLVSALLSAVGNGPEADRLLAWTHGDLSPTNVLVRGERLGLIDFSWSPHVPGRDVAQFVARVFTERPRWERWTRDLTDQLIDGYALGHAGSKATWRIARLERGIKALRSPHDDVRAWGRTTLRELWGEVDES